MQPRRHYPDFTDMENEAILRQVHGMRRRFEIASRGAGSNSLKRALWQEIAHVLNRNTSCPRSFHQVKQRHRAMRFEFKKFKTVSSTENNGGGQLPKWKPFMEVMEELNSNGDAGDEDISSLTGNDADMNEELDGEFPPISSSSTTNTIFTNALDTLLANASSNHSTTPVTNINLTNEDNHLPKPSTSFFTQAAANHKANSTTTSSNTSSSTFRQIFHQNERPSEEIIQVHSSTTKPMVEMMGGGNKRKGDVDLTMEIHRKQLMVLDQQHRNLLLEEQLLQARLQHFAKKSRLLNEALLKSLQNDDDF